MRMTRSADTIPCWSPTSILLVCILSSVAVSPSQYTSKGAVDIEGGPKPDDTIAAGLGFNNLETWERQQVIKSRIKRNNSPPNNERTFYLNDTGWNQMWYLHRMNVVGVWKQGVTGKGVVVTILNDGLEVDHPDLKRNYDKDASYDFIDNDDDPSPRDTRDALGTLNAGLVAATANNSFCGVGVAYGARIGGVRMLDDQVTDEIEGRSLSFNLQHIDIYCASYGPPDDGKTVGGPGECGTTAFIKGVTQGRSGKGSIYVWGTGTGGEKDNCNCDGYSNSIWTLSISSATESGESPEGAEACSSILAAAFTGSLVTTDTQNDKCAFRHGGVTASVPLAAGMCALALEANSALSWRDMQHIIVTTARPDNLHSTHWTVNGVGRRVSHSFGYGLMDATEMVRVARTWQTVPEQHKCEVSAPHINKVILPNSTLRLELNVKECTEVNYLEHVQAVITLRSQRRGNLQILLTSPSGTTATLLTRRPLDDDSSEGFDSWPFMSVHTWGEQPSGVWELEFRNYGDGDHKSELVHWQLILYGTTTAPQTPALAPSPVCVSVNSSGTCLDCGEGWWLVEGSCRRHCPAGFYPESNTARGSRRPQSCGRCHYSCRTCSGPGDARCSSCHDDASTLISTDQTSHCILRSHSSIISSNVINVTSLSLVVIICVFLVGGVLLHSCCRKPNSARRLFTYDMVKYDNTFEYN